MSENNKINEENQKESDKNIDKFLKDKNEDINSNKENEWKCLDVLQDVVYKCIWHKRFK